MRLMKKVVLALATASSLHVSANMNSLPHELMNLLCRDRNEHNSEATFLKLEEFFEANKDRIQTAISVDEDFHQHMFLGLIECYPTSELSLYLKLFAKYGLDTSKAPEQLFRYYLKDEPKRNPWWKRHCVDSAGRVGHFFESDDLVFDDLNSAIESGLESGQRGQMLVYRDWGFIQDQCSKSDKQIEWEFRKSHKAYLKRYEEVKLLRPEILE